MHFRTVWIVVFVSISIALSCHRQDEYETRTVFRYNESKGIATLDPAFARSQTIIWPVSQVFNGLVQLTENLTITPCIAKSWKISEDGLTYTFTLRNDVFFHENEVFGADNSRKVVARDVVFSLNRISDPGTASPGAWIFNVLDKNATPDGKGMEALNDTTVRIYLNKPFPGFLGVLSMQYCSIIPQEAIEVYGKGFRNRPVGTGPFKFKYWREGEKLVLVKNPLYFETDSAGNSLPYIDAIAVSFIADKQSEFMEFIKGEIDFLSGVHAAYKDELVTRSGKLNPKYVGRFTMSKTPYLNTEYLGIVQDTSMTIMRNSPLSQQKVRLAINFGFNRDKMMLYLRSNIGRPAHSGFAPKGLPSFNPEKVVGYSYNPDTARILLREAGFPNGKGLKPVTLTTTSDYLDLCEYIQHELAQIGIPVNIEVSTGATFREMVSMAKVNFFRGSWIADYPDAENYYALFYSENQSPGGPNYTRFDNEAFDQLYARALLINTDSLRYRLYHQMERIILNEAPVVPLYYDEVVRFTQNRIKNFQGNPLNMLILKNVVINE